MATKRSKDAPRYIQTVHMGLGEAVRRLFTVESILRFQSNADPKLVQERNLLLEAMDRIPIEIGFDCNSDGVPDTVAIFKEAAETSCCRLLPLETESPEVPKASPKAPPLPVEEKPKAKRTRSNSRRQEEPEPEDKPTGFFGSLFGTPRKKKDDD